jgi:hypothetical protein
VLRNVWGLKKRDPDAVPTLEVFQQVRLASGDDVNITDFPPPQREHDDPRNTVRMYPFILHPTILSLTH